MHLDTALLFAAFRDAATAEERRRLAREMHDGVAQDIASLGYLVDALARRLDVAGAGRAAAHAARADHRRRRARSAARCSPCAPSVGASESLGAAIGALARHLSEASGIPIQVTVDERTTRLRPEVEAELLRIAQEAMNNAVRHAQAVADRGQLLGRRAPDAEITVRDDGRGLQAGRADSHGLEIMRERALLIGADARRSSDAVPDGTVGHGPPCRHPRAQPAAGRRPGRRRVTA